MTFHERACLRKKGDSYPCSVSAFYERGVGMLGMESRKEGAVIVCRLACAVYKLSLFDLTVTARRKTARVRILENFI